MKSTFALLRRLPFKEMDALIVNEIRKEIFNILLKRIPSMIPNAKK